MACRKEGLGDILVIGYTFLMENGGRHKEHLARVFSVPSERTRGNEHILKCRKHLNITKKKRFLL